MENSISTTAPYTHDDVNSKTIVERIKRHTEAYEIDKLPSSHKQGRKAYEGTTVALGDKPWWDEEVSRPLMAYFKEERLREEREQRELELEKARAQAVQQTVYVSQPAAQTAMSFAPGAPPDVGQINVGESFKAGYYTSMSKP